MIGFTESVVEQGALAWLEARDGDMLSSPESATEEVAAQRDARRPEFISGELRVTDAERILERCL